MPVCHHSSFSFPDSNKSHRHLTSFFRFITTNSIHIKQPHQQQQQQRTATPKTTTTTKTRATTTAAAGTTLTAKIQWTWGLGRQILLLKNTRKKTWRFLRRTTTIISIITRGIKRTIIRKSSPTTATTAATPQIPAFKGNWEVLWACNWLQLCWGDMVLNPNMPCLTSAGKHFCDLCMDSTCCFLQILYIVFSFFG